MRRCADTEKEICEYRCNRCKNEIGMKEFEMYLESLCQSRGSYRWRCLSPLGGDFLEAYASMHDGSQSGSVVAD